MKNGGDRFRQAFKSYFDNRSLTIRSVVSILKKTQAYTDRILNLIREDREKETSTIEEEDQVYKTIQFYIDYKVHQNSITFLKNVMNFYLGKRL